MEDINQQEQLQQIGEDIKREKNLNIINLQAGKGSFGQLITVEDQFKIQYTIKIIPIFNGHNDVCPLKLENAKQEANFLKQCNDPNIVNYLDEFQINFNYFIQMEKHQFISFACQCLSALQYIHSKQYILRDLSLRNILIDRYNRIKICDFGLAKKNYCQLTPEQFKTSCAKREPFYYPPELVDLSQQQKSNSNGITENYSGDTWAFGICFYILGGGNSLDCMKFCSEGFSHLQSLDEDLNKILSQALSKQPDERPDILQMLDEFDALKQELWNDQEELNILFNQFEIFKSEEKFKKALNLCLICLEIMPKEIQLLQNLGYVQFQLKYFDDAIKSYQKCLEINPNDDSCYESLGMIYESKGMFDDAIKSYQTCLEINPKKESCYDNLGIIFQSQGMFDDAIKSHQKYLEINPKKDSCYYYLGIAYYSKGMLDDAIKSYQKYLEINPDGDSCYENLGMAYQVKGMLDDAIKSYQKCLEINPKKESCYYNLGKAYMSKDMIDDAIRQFEVCIQINPMRRKECEDIQQKYLQKN